MEQICFESNFSTAKRLKNALAMFVRCGLVRADCHARFTLTEGGRAYIEDVRAHLDEVRSIRWRQVYGTMLHHADEE